MKNWNLLQKRIRKDDLDPRMCKALNELTTELGLEAVDKFAMSNLDNVRSKTGFMVLFSFSMRALESAYGCVAKTLLDSSLKIVRALWIPNFADQHPDDQSWWFAVLSHIVSRLYADWWPLHEEEDIMAEASPHKREPAPRKEDQHTWLAMKIHSIALCYRDSWHIDSYFVDGDHQEAADRDRPSKIWWSQGLWSLWKGPRLWPVWKRPGIWQGLWPLWTRQGIWKTKRERWALTQNHRLYNINGELSPWQGFLIMIRLITIEGLSDISPGVNLCKWGKSANDTLQMWLPTSMILSSQQT